MMEAVGAIIHQRATIEQAVDRMRAQRGRDPGWLAGKTAAVQRNAS
jgi:chloramphenicol 3-O-phosphotransferase